MAAAVANTVGAITNQKTPLVVGGGSRSKSPSKVEVSSGSTNFMGSSISSLHHRGSAASASRSSRKPAPIECVSVSDAGQKTDVSGGLPLKTIPGTYGLPFFGAIMDRLDFFWFQPVPKFYEARRDKYNSTVFRTNMPPGPPFYPDPRCVVILDEKTYPVLFDVSKVEKKDVFVGTFTPSLGITGGKRVLSYLDPSEPKHALTKQFAFEVLKNAAPRVFPVFAAAFAVVFEKWDAQNKKDGKVKFAGDLLHGTYTFVYKAYTGRDPFEEGENSMGKDGPTDTQLWLLAQIGPITGIPLPWFLAPILGPIIELLLHTFPIPAFVVQKPHVKLENFFRTYGAHLLDIAENIGIEREEALQNLLFLTSFNSWGGVNILFPKVVTHLGSTSAEFQAELAAEVRQAIADNGGELGPKALACMPIVESVIYEVMRIDPPVPYQYGRAKTDLIIESHDGAFEVKKGEMIHGYMPIATRDPKVFHDAETFLPKRFVGDQGKALLKYVLWSNGPQTESPTLENKHCAGKDFVLLVGRLFVATIFNYYDIMQTDSTGTYINVLKPRSA